MITRRLLLASAAVGAARLAAADTGASTFRIGFLWAGAERTRENDPWMREFLEELERRGYAEGKNLILEARGSGGDDKRLPDLAAELIALRPNAILVSATPSLMALAGQHSTIPVVFIIGVDPVGLGVAQSLSHPGGSFTGYFNNAGDVLPKSLQMLRDLLPQARRVGYLTDLTFPPASIERFNHRIKAAADQLGFELKGVEMRPGDDLSAAFDQFAEFKAEAFLGTGGPVWSLYRRSIIEMTRTRRLPAIYAFRVDPVDGGLMSYGSDMDGLFRGTAGYVDRILRGADPADLPIEQATKLILVINLKTARELGLEIPRVLLANASELIE